MVALGNRIALLTGAVSQEVLALDQLRGARPPGGGPRFPPPEPKKGGAVDTAGGALLGAINPLKMLGVGMLLSPLTSLVDVIGKVVGQFNLLDAAFGAKTSGLDTLGKSVQVVGTTLAAFLMPSLVAMAGATFALAVLLDRVLAPNLEEFFDGALESWSSLFEGVEEAVNAAKDALGGLGVEVKDVAKLMGQMSSGIGIVLSALKKVGITPEDLISLTPVGIAGKLAGGDRGHGVGEGKDFGGGDFGDGKKPGGAAADPKAREERRGFMADAVKGMRMALQSMQFGIAGPPAFHTAESAYKAAQAAVYGDPFEMEMLRIMQNQLNAFGKALEKLDGIKDAVRNAAPAVGGRP